MLRWRLIAGTSLVMALVALFWLDVHLQPQGVVLLPLAFALALAAADEMVRLCSVFRPPPHRGTIYLGTLLIVLSGGLPHFFTTAAPAGATFTLVGPALAVALTMLLALGGEMSRYDNPETSARNVALATFASVYVGLMLVFVIELRFLGGENWCGLPLISLIVVVKLGDTGAYTVGRLICRQKLTPRLSPGKTIEGLLGGIVFSCLGSWLLFCVIAAPILGEPTRGVPWWIAIVYGVLVSIAGVVGDLAMSLLKRSASVKDSSI